MKMMMDKIPKMKEKKMQSHMQKMMEEIPENFEAKKFSIRVVG